MCSVGLRHAAKRIASRRDHEIDGPPISAAKRDRTCADGRSRAGCEGRRANAAGAGHPSRRSVGDAVSKLGISGRRDYSALRPQRVGRIARYDSHVPRIGEHMHIFELSELDRQRADEGKAFFEFLRVPPLSLGIYTLAAGAADPQQPHTEDEAYDIVAGRARILVGDDDRPVQPGTVVFVPPGTPHRFHEITEDLTALVIFAPAETV